MTIQTILSSITTMLQKAKALWSKPNIRNIIAITGLLFLSRGLGFARSVLIYNRMDKISGDLLIASTKIPETIASLLIMGTIISSMLPIASGLEQEEKGDKKVSSYLNFMMVSVIFMLSIITLFCLAFTSDLLVFTTSSDLISLFEKQGLFSDYVLTTRILLIGPFLFALQAIFGVFLNIKHRFAVYSWAGAIYNIGTICGILIGVRNGYIQTSIGMMLGAFLTVILFWHEAQKFGYSSHLSSLFRVNMFSLTRQAFVDFKSNIIATWKVFLPRIFLINGAILANLLITRVAQNAGQVTAFDIGLSIQGLFFSLVTSVGTVFFPDLAKAFNSDIKDKFWEKLNLYGKYIILTSIVGSLFTVVFAPVVMWLFELLGKGQNNADYIVLIARVCTLGLIFQSLNEILSKYFYVRQRVWQPVIISTLGLIGQLIAVFTLIRFKFDAGISVSVGLGVANFVVSLVSLWLIRIDKNKETLHKLTNKV